MRVSDTGNSWAPFLVCFGQFVIYPWIADLFFIEYVEISPTENTFREIAHNLSQLTQHQLANGSSLQKRKCRQEFTFWVINVRAYGSRGHRFRTLGVDQMTKMHTILAKYILYILYLQNTYYTYYTCKIHTIHTILAKYKRCILYLTYNNIIDHTPAGQLEWFSPAETGSWSWNLVKHKYLFFCHK